MGIPAKDLAHVFERFYQVESHLTRKHGGMGLGLSVAKVMIEMHGGRIWAESTEGKGSTFTFLLPLNLKNNEPDPSTAICRMKLIVQSIHPVKLVDGIFVSLIHSTPSCHCEEGFSPTKRSPAQNTEKILCKHQHTI